MAGAGGRLGVNVLKSGGIVNRVIVNRAGELTGLGNPGARVAGF